MNKCKGCHCNFGKEVDGNKIGTWDGFITIFSGYDDNAKIKNFCHTANGTEDDTYITLEDCRKMIGDTEEPVTVIFNDFTHGEIYNFGNYGKKWCQIGITQGFA